VRFPRTAFTGSIGHPIVRRTPSGDCDVRACSENVAVGQRRFTQHVRRTVRSFSPAFTQHVGRRNDVTMHDAGPRRALRVRDRAGTFHPPVSPGWLIGDSAGWVSGQTLRANGAMF
jgi:hypothetical protein